MICAQNWIANTYNIKKNISKKYEKIIIQKKKGGLGIHHGLA